MVSKSISCHVVSQFYPTSTGLSKGSEVKPSCLRGHFEEEFSLNVDSSKALEAEDMTVKRQPLKDQSRGELDSN